jgi:hypothetical protein
MALTGDGQCGRQGQCHGHDCHFDRDRDSTAVARCERAAGSHIVRLRHANAISTAVTAILADNTRPYPVAYKRAGDPSVTTAPATPPANSAATHTNDSCENRGSTRAHCPRCSTVSTSPASAPHHSAGPPRR